VVNLNAIYAELDNLMPDGVKSRDLVEIFEIAKMPNHVGMKIKGVDREYVITAQTPKITTQQIWQQLVHYNDAAFRGTMAPSMDSFPLPQIYTRVEGYVGPKNESIVYLEAKGSLGFGYSTNVIYVLNGYWRVYSLNDAPLKYLRAIGKAPQKIKKDKPKTDKIEIVYSSNNRGNTPTVTQDNKVCLPVNRDDIYMKRVTEIVERTDTKLVVRVHVFVPGSDKYTCNKTSTFNLKRGQVKKEPKVPVNVVPAWQSVCCFERNPFNSEYHHLFPAEPYSSNILYITGSGQVFGKLNDMWVMFPKEMEYYWKEMGMTEDMFIEYQMYQKLK